MSLILCPVASSFKCAKLMNVPVSGREGIKSTQTSRDMCDIAAYVVIRHMALTQPDLDGPRFSNTKWHDFVSSLGRLGACAAEHQTTPAECRRSRTTARQAALELRWSHTVRMAPMIVLWRCGEGGSKWLTVWYGDGDTTSLEGGHVTSRDIRWHYGL